MKQIIVIILLAVSGCVFPSIPRAQTSSQVRGPAGHYEGTALNTTANKQGKVTLDLYDLNSQNDHARAYCGFSAGLSGEAWLTGNISNGQLRLTGTLSNFQMTIIGQLTSNGTIKAAYQLSGTTSENGNFEVAFQHSLPSFPVPNQLDLVGAWEIGGGLPSQTNPITGEATGVSFVEARRLEIFPNGRFQHLRSHRHCEGAGFSRCCSEQAVLEQGSLSVAGRQLIFTIEGGNTINRDSCNPKLNLQSEAKPMTASFNWSLRHDNGTLMLCLQNGADQPVCYRKQS